MDYQYYHSLFTVVHFRAANQENKIKGCIRVKLAGKTVSDDTPYCKMSLPERGH